MALSMVRQVQDRLQSALASSDKIGRKTKAGEDRT
jgi:hypothetical protein